MKMEDQYTGDFNNGAFNGRDFPIKRWLEGDFVNGQAEGQEEVDYRARSRSEGTFKQGVFSKNSSLQVRRLFFSKAPARKRFLCLVR